MTSLPTLETQRLYLRPFRLEDADELFKLAGDYDVSQFVPKIPHPYSVAEATEWIAGLDTKYKAQKQVVFAVVLRHAEEDLGSAVLNDRIRCDHLVGSVRLEMDRPNDCAELGYWIGTEFAGKGYCTEASQRLLQYGFQDLGLNCIWAGHFSTNAASGKVIAKLGMKYEGRLRARFKKMGNHLDDDTYSLLRSEFSS